MISHEQKALLRGPGCHRMRTVWFSAGVGGSTSRTSQSRSARVSGAYALGPLRQLSTPEGVIGWVRVSVRWSGKALFSMASIQ